MQAQSASINRGASHLLSYGSCSYTYKNDGSLQTKTCSDGTTTYDYDAFGNLRGVMLPSGTTVTYLIDGQNRRVGKKINGSLVESFVYDDGFNRVGWYDGNGALRGQFTFHQRPYAPDSMVRVDGQVYKVVYDQVGSIRQVVAPDGTIAERLDYDEFGNILTDSAPGFQPFGFAGGLRDSDTGLVRFGFRDYIAPTGRWTNRDPLLFGGGITNIYSYVANDPVNANDPWGLYGTNDCSYYHQRCLESGGKYYCVQAPYWCHWFPKYPDPDPNRSDDFEGWPRCTRQCLQDCDREQNKNQNSCPAKADDRRGPWDPRSESAACHVKCYASCASEGVRTSAPPTLPPYGMWRKR